MPRGRGIQDPVMGNNSSLSLLGFRTSWHHFNKWFISKINKEASIMSNQLIFNNTPLTIINHNNQIWFTSSELAKALGYKDGKSISIIFSRNQDEFSDSMTEVINLITSNNLKRSRRIFSLRGAHLIAMLSNTEVAKDFRKWVLDILDKQANDPELEVKLALLNARFLASFDSNLQLQVKTVPENTYLVDINDRDHVTSFVKECIPPEYLPEVVNISLNRLSHLFKEDKLIYIE